MTEGAPPWDESLAEALLKRTVLVGVATATENGTVLGYEQLYGTVTSADASGVVLELKGERAGEVVLLPPDPRAYTRAAPGEYRLRTTGEVVSNPDYLSVWTRTPPPAGEQS
jgi:hypothetical protein